MVPAADLTAAQLAQVRDFYEDAFPVAERAPFDTLFADRFLVLLSDERPVGLSVLRALGERPWIFLRYFAARDRGQGVGTRLWRHLVEAHPHHDRIVLDVEDPDEAGIGEDQRELRLRRIAFYRRLGIDLPPVVGYAPPHDGQPLPLRLMVGDIRVPSTPPVVGDDLREVVLAVYEHRYGLGHGSAEVRRTLELSGLTASPPS